MTIRSGSSTVVSDCRQRRTARRLSVDCIGCSVPGCALLKGRRWGFLWGLMEGLRNLSPRRLHTLLVACRSVKVKRLFLWFAERHEHPWLEKMDRKKIDLGHGKRMLVRGGKLIRPSISAFRTLSMPLDDGYRK